MSFSCWLRLQECQALSAFCSAILSTLALVSLPENSFSRSGVLPPGYTVAAAAPSSNCVTVKAIRRAKALPAGQLIILFDQEKQCFPETRSFELMSRCPELCGTAIRTPGKMSTRAPGILHGHSRQNSISAKKEKEWNWVGH